MKRKIGNMMIALLSIMMMCGLFAVTASAATIPDDAISYGKHYYKYFNKAMTWTQAKQACEKMGGHLVDINSAGEQSFLTKHLPSVKRNCYWIGLYYKKGWKWVTGRVYSYENWAIHEPNNYHSKGESYAHLCGILYTSGNRKNVGEWNDCGNSGAGYANKYFDLKNFGYICEWEKGTVRQSLKKASVTLSKTQYVYDGKSKTPSVKVVLNKKTLKKGKDYTVTYIGSSKIGTARVRITGKGNYKDQVDKTYKILPGKVSISVSSKTPAQAVVSCKTVKGATGYQYFWKKKSASSYHSKATSSKRLTITKMAAGQSYVFKVRAYTKVGNKYYYGAYSPVKTVKIYKQK